MKTKFAIAAATLLLGLGAAGSASAAMPNGLPNIAPANNVETVRWVCDAYGRCFHQPNFYGPRYYGYGYPRPRFYGGYGYGRRFYGGGGWRRW